MADPIPQENPQNPYHSFVVNASAGTGKTYQLAHRFLCLVGAGADPGAILTLTFTKKAAGEMRERILQEAARLLQDAAARDAFEAKMRLFHAARPATAARTPAPLPAAQTADRILGASQLLKITTIDAAFMDWYRKFPWDATRSDDGEAAPPPPGTTILDNQGDADALNRKAWQKAYWEASHRADELGIGEWDNADIYGQLKPMLGNETFVWGVRRDRRHEPWREGAYAGAVNFHPRAPHVPDDAAAVWDALAAPLRAVLEATTSTKRDAWLAAWAQGSLEALQSAGVFTKEWRFNQTSFKKHPRQDQLGDIEAVIQSFHDQKRLAELNRRAALLAAYHEGYDAHRQTLKRERAKMEFADAAFGAFTLFHEDHAVGARYLIHQRLQHVLLDEFQDTSRLQWHIFRAMAEDLLAGAGIHGEKGIVPTLFIVGDPKQSIYGFREADAAIMAEAAAHLEPFDVVPVRLTHSFRTAPLLLDWVNAAFAAMPGFPAHATAAGPDGAPLIPDVAEALVCDVGDPDADAGRDAAAAAAREAAGAAAIVAQWLAEAQDHPVWDKRHKHFRPMRAADVAILYRESTHAQAFEDALRARGIASRREEGRGFFKRPEVDDLMALLRWSAHPGDAVALLQVLKSPLFGRPDAEILALLEAVPATENAARRSLALEDVLARERPALAEALRELRRVRLAHGPLPFLAHAYRRFRIPARFRVAAPAEDAEVVHENCQAFFRLAQQAAEGGKDDVLSLLDALGRMAEADTLGNAPAAADAVTLMTIHKSKGLEFPAVVLVGTGHAWEKRDHYWAKGEDPDHGPGLYYMGTKAQQPRNDGAFDRIYADQNAKARAESERLLYVAMTRAQQYLAVCGVPAKRAGGHGEAFLARLRDAAASLGAHEEEWAGLTCWRLGRRGVAVVMAPAAALAPAAAPAADEGDDHEPPLPATPIPPMQVLAPHRHLSVGDVSADLRAALALAPGEAELLQAAGNYIHAGLEAFVRGTPFDGPQVWRSFVPDAGPWDESMHQAADREWRAVVQHPAFQGLLAEAIGIHTEKAVAHFDGRNLVRGFMDLMVEKADGTCVVVDYKSTPLAADDAATLERLAAERGYFRQLRYYAEALAAMGRWRHVRAAVYFTKVNQLVYWQPKAPVDSDEGAPLQDAL